MKKFYILFLTIFSQLAFGQVNVTLPRDSINSSMPVPIEIQVPQDYSKNFQLSLKLGGKDIINVATKGDVGISKVSTRFRATNSQVEIAIKSGKLFSNSNEAINVQSFSNIPADASEEQVTVGTNQYTFTKGNKEYLSSNAENGNFRFIVKGAISKNSFVKQVVVKLSKDGTNTTEVTITGSDLWWQPFFSLNGDFNNAQIVSVTYSNN